MTYIPEALRRQVIARAQGCCEYCLLHEDDSPYPHEVDHIIPEKHRGETTADNLCFSCYECNRHKGSDFASFDPLTDEIERLFDPRQHRWDDHFHLSKDVILEPLTSVGRVTEFILKLNTRRRQRERAILIDLERYPCRR